jgi:hypothetical protein
MTEILDAGRDDPAITGCRLPAGPSLRTYRRCRIHELAATPDDSRLPR